MLSYFSLFTELGFSIASSNSSYFNPNCPSSVLASSHNPSVGAASIISLSIPSSLPSSHTSVLLQSAIGDISTPPSPYFVKNPTPKSSTLLPVPTTIPLL